MKHILCLAIFAAIVAALVCVLCKPTYPADARALHDAREAQVHESLRSDMTWTRFCDLYPYHCLLGYWQRDSGSGYTEITYFEGGSLLRFHIWSRDEGLREWTQVDYAGGTLLLGGVR
jgi:hypothetical protein